MPKNLQDMILKPNQTLEAIHDTSNIFAAPKYIIREKTAEEILYEKKDILRRHFNKKAKAPDTFGGNNFSMTEKTHRDYITDQIVEQYTLIEYRAKSEQIVHVRIYFKNKLISSTQKFTKRDLKLFDELDFELTEEHSAEHKQDILDWV